LELVYFSILLSQRGKGKNKNKNFCSKFSKIKTKIRFFNRGEGTITDGIYTKYMFAV